MRTIAFKVTATQATIRLDRLLAGQLREAGFEVSNRRAKQLVDGGSVRIDGRRAWKASDTAPIGARVEVDVPADPQDSVTPIDIESSVIYEDAWLLAIDKPPGLPTHATHDPDRDHAHQAVARLLAARGVETPYVGIHHRLDVDTSGVLLFAIDRAANKGLADAFSQRDAKKTYEALCVATPSDAAGTSWVVENHLGRDRSASARNIAVTSGGDLANTSFEIREILGSAASVVAHPLTGRMHQIRTHLAQDGRPILGDLLYGGPTLLDSVPVPRLMLHAARLVLPHPITGAPLTIEAPLPDEIADLANALRAK